VNLLEPVIVLRKLGVGPPQNALVFHFYKTLLKYMYFNHWRPVNGRRIGLYMELPFSNRTKFGFDRIVIPILVRILQNFTAVIEHCTSLFRSKGLKWYDF
jgi:hypothetical protein